MRDEGIKKSMRGREKTQRRGRRGQICKRPQETKTRPTDDRETPKDKGNDGGEEPVARPNFSLYDLVKGAAEEVRGG